MSANPCLMCVSKGRQYSDEGCKDCAYSIAIKDIRLILENFPPSGLIEPVYQTLCKRYGVEIMKNK